MMEALYLAMENGETLRCAIHAVLLIDDSFTAGYFGITDDNLVAALPSPTGKAIVSKAHIALKDIASVEQKTTKLTHQVIITIELKSGAVYRVRASEKAHGLPKQAEQLALFTKKLTSLPNE